MLARVQHQIDAQLSHSIHAVHAVRPVASLTPDTGERRPATAPFTKGQFTKGQPVIDRMGRPGVVQYVGGIDRFGSSTSFEASQIVGVKMSGGCGGCGGLYAYKQSELRGVA